MYYGTSKGIFGKYHQYPHLLEWAGSRLFLVGCRKSERQTASVAPFKNPPPPGLNIERKTMMMMNIKVPRKELVDCTEHLKELSWLWDPLLG